MPIKKTIIIFLIIIQFFFISSISAKISEKKLNHYNSYFTNRMIKDNPEKKSIILQCLDSIVDSDNTGIRLIDKFGIFINDMKKNNIKIHRTRFLGSGNTYHFFITFRDTGDGQMYSLFLEYKFASNMKHCRLKDSCFSLVFKDKLEDIKHFFQ